MIIGDPLLNFEYQSALLGYFAQQSVAHGAMLFSAVIATFYFFRLLRERYKTSGEEETRRRGFGKLKGPSV